MNMKRKLAFALVAMVAALTVGSIAWAAIPDTGGVIRGCYEKGTGQLRVTDTQTNMPKGCGAKEVSLDWSVRGPMGPAGPEGPAGPPRDGAADAFVGSFGADTGNATAAPSVPCTLGQIILSASPTKTAGGMPATGQLLPIAQNTALFALLGTTYGGDGKVTFALPDLRSIAPNHMTYSICTYGTWPS